MHTVRSVLNDSAGEVPAQKKKKTPDDPLEAAKKYAVEYLKRPHSEKELRDKLTQKGCRPQDIEQAVALCTDYGFLNDADYAAMLVRHYGARGYGPGRIRQELYRRGVDKELWDDAFEELNDQEDTIDRMLASALRGRDVTDRKQRDKAANALFRRGFAWEEIRAAMARYTSEYEQELDD